MIDFKRLQPEQKQYYDRYLMNCGRRGCEYSFPNLFLWGRQTAAEIGGFLVLFSHFEGRSVYTFPVGQGDIKPVLDAIIEDSRERGIPCRLTSLLVEDCRTLEQLYPGQFRCNWDRNSYDYVYAIEDLAHLRGRKYIKKRNHLHQFEAACPDWRVEPMGESNLDTARRFTGDWLSRREEETFRLEKIALERAFRYFKELELEGMLLYVEDRPVAMTIGSRLTEDTFDIHFEKADETVSGAYNAINREFAAYLQKKYPELVYLNREDDLGIPGLRTAKESYRPVDMIAKCWVYLGEQVYED